MGNEVKTAKDRLEEALRERDKSIIVAGTELVLRKWTLRQGIKHSALLFKLLLKVANGVQGNVDLLKLPIDDFIKAIDTDVDTLVTVLSDTIRNNFDDSQTMAKGWVESLPPEDALALAKHIAGHNISPLMKAAGEIKNFAAPVASQAQAE